MSAVNFPAADFTPQLVGYTGQGAFRFWCQKVLPIVYDDSLSYYELLNKVVIYLNNIIKDVSGCEDNIESLATAFRLLEEYVNNYTLVVNPATVEEILEQHPEWTTTVQDGAISLEKLNRNVRVMLGNGNTAIASYIGDFISCPDMLPSACLKVDGGFIMIEASASAVSNADNSGVVREFGWEWDFYNRRLIKNEEYVDKRKVVDLGHANSMAFDGTHIWVAPVWDYTQYSGQGVQRLYRYNTDFSVKEDIATPITPNAVTFDPVTKTLYCCNFYSYSNPDDAPGSDEVYTPPDCCTVYKLDSGSWVEYTKIMYNDFSPFNVRSFTGGFQDFAVYDNKFYLSSPYGSIYYGALIEYECGLEGCLRVSPFDSRGWFRLGELEGMEFDKSGHLYAVMYIRIGTSRSYLKNGFIVELNVGTAMPITTNILGPMFDSHQDILELSDASVKCFSIGTNQIRCLQQLGSTLRTQTKTIIQVPSGSNVVEEDWTVIGLKKHLNGETGNDSLPTPRSVVCRDSFQFNVLGSYSCDFFNIEGGEIEFYGTPNSGTIICNKDNTSGDGIIIRVRECGSVKFTGASPVKFSLPNIASDDFPFINTGSFGGEIWAETVPTCLEGYELKINEYSITQRNLYMGYTLVNGLRVGSAVYLIGAPGYIQTNQRCTFRINTEYCPKELRAMPSGNCRILTPNGILSVVIDAGGNTIDTFDLGVGTGTNYSVTASVSSSGKYIDLNFLFSKVQASFTVNTPIMLVGASGNTPKLTMAR